MTACRNCDAMLYGRFCHACGQKAVSADISVHDLVHEGIIGGILMTLLLLMMRSLRQRHKRYTFRSLVTRPTSTHSTTKIFPS